MGTKHSGWGILRGNRTSKLKPPPMKLDQSPINSNPNPSFPPLDLNAKFSLLLIMEHNTDPLVFSVLFLVFLSYYFMYTSVLPAFMSVYHMHA